MISTCFKFIGFAIGNVWDMMERVFYVLGAEQLVYSLIIGAICYRLMILPLVGGGFGNFGSDAVRATKAAKNYKPGKAANSKKNKGD